MCSDCSDTDPDNWDSCATCVDEDGDGAYAGCDAYVMRAGEDCEPLDPAIHPGATEICDNIDNDCVGGVDDNVAYLDYYLDGDGDGYGDGGAAPVNDCTPPAGRVPDATDCDDGDPNNWASCSACVDGDGDGTYAGCDAYQTILEDCDDGDGANFPGNTEVCDGADNDCAGGADDGLTFSDYWPDIDGDGFGDALAAPVSACAPPAGTAPNGNDCADGDPTVNPGAVEICEDTIDNDCVGGDAVCACGNGSLESGEVCDDGNLCAYDGCSGDPAGAVNQCQGEETVVLTTLALGTGTTGFDLDGDGTIDNRLGSNGTLRGEFNNILAGTLDDGSLMQVFTIAALDNVPYSGTGTPGYQDDPDVVVSLYPTVDPACTTGPVYGAANPPPWIAGPWPVELYSDADAWDTATCVGGAQITDADDPANGIYPTGGGQLANPAPPAPYLRAHASQLSLALVGVQTVLHDATIEATVVDDTAGISALTNGVLGGAVAARSLWGIPLDGPGGSCETALHAVRAVAGVPDIDIDGDGSMTISVSCAGGWLACLVPCGGAIWSLGDCVDEAGTVIPDSDLNGDGVVSDGECLLDPRMDDGYSAGMTFTAQEVSVTRQVSASTYCP
ncbi:MAG: MopE-related protein [Deltaproteobacteria bacterium]|nr:MopE-related protein [Deltaproteobacteria bacterium]